MVAKPSHNALILFSLLLLSTTLNLVAAHGGAEISKCVCLRDTHDDHEGHDHGDEKVDKKLLNYKIVSIFTILGASVAGFYLPFLGKFIPALRPERGTFFLMKAFSAGIILSTAFIHILPESFRHFTSPCLGEDSTWTTFPFTGLFTMIGALFTLMMDSFANRHFHKAGVPDDEAAKDIHAHAHSHGGQVPEGLSKGELIRYRVTSQVLEIGIVVHSVIIGITMGAADSIDSVKPLIVAMCFHQFFEGIGLGGCVAQAAFNSISTLFMGLVFSITTPLGIAIGIGIANVYDEASVNSLIVQGLLNSIASGILIYMALVDLLAQDFMNPKVQKNAGVFFGANFTMLLGAASMAILAKWA